MLGSVPGCWRWLARAPFSQLWRRRRPNSCHQPRTHGRPTPRIQNSKFQPQPQLVNMTAGKSTSQSRSGPCGCQFKAFRLENVEIFSVKDFLIVCAAVWHAAVRRLAVPRGCSSSLRKPLKWIAKFWSLSTCISCEIEIGIFRRNFLAKTRITFAWADICQKIWEMTAVVSNGGAWFTHVPLQPKVPLKRGNKENVMTRRWSKPFFFYRLPICLIGIPTTIAREKRGKQDTSVF